MRDCAAEVLEDVQGRSDPRAIPIQRVGVKAVRHPLQILDRAGHVQHVAAFCNMYVGLPAHLKGTHMSRFLQILQEQLKPLSVKDLEELLSQTRDRLEARSARIELQFPYFVRKKAPVSRVESYLDYEVEWQGEIQDDQVRAQLCVHVPVTSLCPCSKSISEYGAHNQRSRVSVQVEAREALWIEDIIDLVESEASSQLYGVLKRPDEKYVTEYAYDHPKFVEDMVRDVALRLQNDPRVRRYSVASENFESIHNHSAYAYIEGEN
ncbi:GTP cyclohydrolase FolE2 [Candidatus Igneacidithiobacillus taiwanensis]|uniref:GTP cyclohydrolase FolE2 n=1 Tax=Candidatus Igneacidithiobacillus taiwanensis TaxID=1945924 RepID=UPI00289B2A28|nr:GTP cyclohydrolase FolE2 [Candidatus Igneacidithiobacillus taiwanensis]MCE5360913.1 GTP cyclohydrolase I FolE2 [Acidithiobacillus sp.]